MKDFYKTKIIDQLYEIREETIESKYAEESKGKGLFTDSIKKEKQLVEFCKKFIKDENDISNFFDKLNDFELSATSELCSKYKTYYKTGFADGISIINSIEKQKQILKKDDQTDSIIYKNMNEIFDFFEDEKQKRLKTNQEYQKVNQDIENIKDKYPKVKDFMQNEKIDNLSKEELKAILEIIEMYENRAMYEANEMLKIGLREGKAL